MHIRLSQKTIALSISVFFFISLVIIAKTFHGTGDEGDSVMHFLYAKYAFRHPYHFFHHWAKPVYVLLTCLPAQFGFIGIQLFNIFINALSIYLSFKVAQKLNIHHAWLASLFLAAFPHEIVYSLSGLTEPLFAFTLILIIFLWLNDKKISAIIILSFLPFIRSEGMVVMLVFFIYLLIKKEWKITPLFIIGHVVYAVLGHLFYDKPFMWVFSENPYAVGASSYGSGPWDAFIVNIRFSTGIILYYVLWAGMLLGAAYTFLKFILRKNVNFSLEDLFLIYGIFFSVFFFHSFAWYKGWFHSFGLIRVIVGVLPLVAIICAKVLDETFTILQKKAASNYLVLLVTILIVFFNFYNKKYAIADKRDINIHEDQECQQQMAQYMKTHYPEYKNMPVYFAAPYISEVLNLDYFDDAHPDLKKDFHNNTMRKPCYLIWDDWYALVGESVTLDEINNKSEFKKIKEFSKREINEPKIRTTIIFKVE